MVTEQEVVAESRRRAGSYTWTGACCLAAGDVQRWLAERREWCDKVIGILVFEDGKDTTKGGIKPDKSLMRCSKGYICNKDAAGS